MNTRAASILVVDDMPDNLRLISDVLQAEGYAVRVAPGGEMALQSVRTRLPDLILLDIKMPDLDGFEVCRRLKADPASRDMPVIFLSALREHEDKLRGFELGAVDYITKPFVAEEVLARVRTHLALHNMQQELERQVAERTRALRTLSAGNQAVVHAEDVDQLLRAMCAAIVDEGGYRAAWVMLDDGHQHQCGGSAAVPPQACSELLGGAHRVDGPVLLTPPGWRIGQILCACGAGTALVLPVLNGRRDMGQLVVFADEVGSFSQAREIELLSEMAGELGYGVATLRTREVQARSFAQTIEALAATIEVRDPYTAGHQQRTTTIADAIGRRLGLDEERLKGLLIAGTVHDIGKISVPASILSKPGRLSEAEFAIIKRHPQTGYEILKGIEFPWQVAEIIHQHHERMDGSGYPQGLKGEEILPEARILAVADVLEAISSHRPYRPALGTEVAVAELKKQRGTQLDGEAVDACLQLLEEGALQLPQ